VRLDSTAMYVHEPSCFVDCMEFLFQIFHVFNVHYAAELDLVFKLLESNMSLRGIHTPFELPSHRKRGHRTGSTSSESGLKNEKLIKKATHIDIRFGCIIRRSITQRSV